jgi:low temperature requirement protein LtrA
MADGSGDLDGSAEHAVTPLELFFDLVFVFAITQVTSLLTHDPTWQGVFRGVLVLAAVWWAWTGYAWLTSTLDVDEGVVRLVMLASMAAMLGVALAVPGAFGDDAVLFGFS